MPSKISRPRITGPVSAKRFTASPQSQISGWTKSRKGALSILSNKLYALRPPVGLVEPIKNPVIIVCISDTHNLQPALPDGDLLVHTGDLTQTGTFDELQAQLDWLSTQRHRRKIVIGGNHDLLLDSAFVDRFPERITESPGKRRSDLAWGDIKYLENESVVYDFSNGRRLKIYGTPHTPQYGNWAFQFPPIRDVFSGTIPPDTDILLTHGPPKFHLDTENPKGCDHLLKEIWRAHRNLKLMVFGHIHSGYGTEWLAFDTLQRAHEKILLGEGKIFTLLNVAFHLLSSWIAQLLGSTTGEGNARGSHTLDVGTWVRQMFGLSRIGCSRLVNAAIACGSTNMEAREPIVVRV